MKFMLYLRPDANQHIGCYELLMNNMQFILGYLELLDKESLIDFVIDFKNGDSFNIYDMELSQFDIKDVTIQASCDFPEGFYVKHIRLLIY